MDDYIIKNQFLNNEEIRSKHIEYDKYSSEKILLKSYLKLFLENLGLKNLSKNFYSLLVR